MPREGNRTVDIRSDYNGASFKYVLEGGSLYGEKYIWDVVVTVTWGEKSLNFYVYSRTKTEDQNLTQEWTRSLTQRAARRLKIGNLSAFKSNDLTHGAVDEDETGQSITVELSQKAFEELEREQEYADLAERSFKHAVDRLYSFAMTPSQHGYSDAASMLFFIERSLESAHLGVMYGWYREKLSAIRRYIPSLANRKQRSHPNFKYEQDYVTGNLSCFTAPPAWIGKPNAFDEKVLQPRTMSRS